MTFKSLLNFGAFHKEPPVSHHTHYGIMDRYHGESYHDHGWHGSKGKGGGGGGAALSALTLLAFLFLINVMQQSLMENNATETTTAQSTIFLREDQQPISLTSRFDNDQSIEKGTLRDSMKKDGKKDISYVKIKSTK
ncbi:uncharacterized protein LOC131673799 [Phymastichus coffea]|uniref:uncharacterized protein LOC131667855 n=1 Tax=Phymastichus coffea TaxID=108790 RepID=UPI00273C2505|nr:uncharacterized protein LOC131667855 [Phymastichus coffea]XP_058808074.1 uncharacterized protein LOC131673799 [Phymastichus coffea]